ncbi:MAG: hypothetical protein Ta2D_06970 [Rickettsiales bacterium]|nr:MAG: hypothetical protein Ta2D_06970 [Rickettsiales bacterium]
MEKMKKILITAGPTYEPIDPVRFIGNRSSGKQGIAIAKVFAENNWEVDLVVGPVSELLLQDLPTNIKIHKVNTALDMLDTALKYINVDVAIHNAAVSDYRVENPSPVKMKKDEGYNFANLKFVENPDILNTFGHHPNRPKIVIGFAAETNDLIENGKRKLLKKNADFIMVNDVSNDKVFGKDKNKLYIISKDKVEETEELDKYLIAEKVFEVVNV